MFEELNIRNFQSHRLSSLKFSPGVNVIAGPSDAGKTSIIRALKWLIDNRPVGDSFRTIDSKFTNVVLTVNDVGKSPFQIHRIKSNTINLYRLDFNDKENSMEEFKAFGKNVPEPIQKALQIDSINIQNQMDAPFLLSSSSGEVAQILNKIVNLDIIDKALSEINSQKRTTTQSINSKTEVLEESEKELIKYNYLKQFEKDIEILEAIEGKLSVANSKDEQLRNLIKQHTILSGELPEIDHILKAEPKVKQIENTSEKIEQLDTEITKLENNIKWMQVYESEKHELAKITSLQPQASAMMNMHDDIITKSSKINILQHDIKIFDSTAVELTSIDLELINSEKEFKKLMPNNCPLCGYKISTS